MTRLFGTDGVRGVANTELTCEMAYRLGQAAVEFLGKTIVVGKDTRLSGDMLEAALSAGIMSKGGAVLAVGIVPTPAVALLVRELYADGGIVISASHNPPEYNGIKFFDAEGFKLSTDQEDEIEAFVSDTCISSGTLPAGDAVGIIVPVEDGAEQYIDYVVNSVESDGIRFDGLTVALDVGHGAAALTSEQALRRLGAEVIAINDDFSGIDINVGCGSTELTPLLALMRETRADVGIAHDGDADRVMIVDARGVEIDGDIIAAICALDLKRRGKLAKNKVISTVMCNLGFLHAMRDAGIVVEQTQVGDRFVLERMREEGVVLGGEQSGHIIMLEHNSTGDGLLVACHFLAACKRILASIEEAAETVRRYPQALVNVRDVDKQGLDADGEVTVAIEEASRALGDEGRILVRASGTEPVIRVMVEAATQERAHAVAESIAHVIKQRLSLRDSV